MTHDNQSHWQTVLRGDGGEALAMTVVMEMWEEIERLRAALVETPVSQFPQQREMALAWIEVCKQLSYHNKEWCQQDGTGVDCALQEIRRLQSLEKR